MIKLLLPLSLLLASIVCNAQPHTASASTRDASQAPQRTERTQEADSTEVTVLKQQLSTMREYHGSLLDTVYWALAGIITLVVLLSGFGWWSNFKVYEQDKARLKEELQTLLRSAEADLALRIEEALGAMERSMEGRLEDHTARVQPVLAELRISIDQERVIRERAIAEAKESVEKLGYAQDKSVKLISLAEANLRHVEEHVWLLKDVPDNILITQAQGLAAAALADASGEVESILYRMKEALELHYVKGNNRLDRLMQSHLENVLAKVKDDQQVLLTEIRRTISQVAAEESKPAESDA